MACRCLEPAGRLAAELLPAARSMAALQRLQPARWARFWDGQLHEGGPGGQQGRLREGRLREGLLGEEEAEAAGLATAAAEDDAIEESADEDDW